MQGNRNVKSSQVKSSQVKSKILAAILGLGLISGVAQAQVTNTETLNFDNNQLSSGWNLGNGVIQNQRLEIDPVGSGLSTVRLWKILTTQNATQIQFDYDSSLVAPVLAGSVPSMVEVRTADFLGFPPGVLIMRPTPNSPNLSNLNFPNDFEMYVPSGVNGSVIHPVSLGNYHYSMIVTTDSFRDIYTFENGVVIDSGVVGIPSRLMPDSSDISFIMGSIPGEATTWVDNVSISITTAVPEPETYAMLLAGLGVLGAVSRRKRKQTICA